MKDYGKNKESSYLQYWYVNNLYGWAMLQKRLVNNFEWTEDTSQFNEDFIKDYNVESDDWCFLHVDIQYLEKLHELHNDLPFLLEWMKIEKIEKLVANLHVKTEYVIHIRNSKQALNHGLVFKKVHRVIKFNQNAWLKPYIDMNTDLKKVKNDFEKEFLKLMKKKERRRNYLLSEPNYHITKSFTEYVLAIEIKQTQMFMKKPGYLGLSMLELSNILMYEFRYDYVKQKYGKKSKLGFMDTESFILYIKTDDTYKDIAEDVETWFDTSYYKLDRPLPKGKKLKSNWIDEK